MSNGLIARYYSLPHLVIPLPFLVFLPPLLHGLPLDDGVATVVAVAISTLLAIVFLRRLPKLFVQDPESSPAIAAAVMLGGTMAMAMVADEYRRHSTAPSTFAGVAATLPGEYYEVPLPVAPDFSRLEVIAERLESVRRGVRYELDIAVPYGSTGDGTIYLVERPNSSVGRSPTEEGLAVLRRSMIGGIQTRFEARARSGQWVIRRLSTEEFLPGPFLADDVLLEWGIERPEDQLSSMVPMSVGMYVVYCLLFVIAPLFKDEDPKIVARFLEEPRLLWRLFAFRAPKVEQEDATLIARD